MVKYITNINILNDDELLYIDNFCKSINEALLDDPLPGRNSYRRKVIILKNETIQKILNTVKNNYGIKCRYRGSWINIVDNTANKDDKFHYDDTDFSLIIYLNDNYVGGELEYENSSIKGDIKKIKPIKNSAILLSKNVLHRVLPVLSGKRYSMATFFNYDESFIKEKSLI